MKETERTKKMEDEERGEGRMKETSELSDSVSPSGGHTTTSLS